jgi:uncharacterized membrane protein YcgQ (UPF0703/DUF1980 family)
MEGRKDRSMKFNQKHVKWVVLAVIVLLLCILPWKKIAKTSVHQAGSTSGTQQTKSISDETDKDSMPAGTALTDTEKNQEQSQEKNQEQNQETNQETAKAADSAAASSASSTAPADPPQMPTVVSDEYPYDIEKDRETFSPDLVDITVGDKLYMTQINDWFVNFKDYADKTVKIEGYYINFDNKYTFVGRSGPTCPYCTGGYVDFEFKTDQDLSSFTSLKTWISVTGILREGKSALSNGETTPFYYIEAMNVTKMDQPGVDPISD